MSDAMTEFRITSDLAVLRQQAIEANFEEVRAWLDENLAPYRNMAVTEDAISTAKTYRANIRKVRDRIDACRKEAKAAALAAYTDFETRCKALTSLCDDAAGALDSQVKAFEQAERDAKIDKLHGDYVALTDDEMEEYCPWALIFNEKWGNKSFPYEAAFSEINAAIDKARNDLSAIRDMGGDDTAYLLDVYKQTHDLSAVVRKASDLKTAREREAARKQREAEIEAAKAEAARRAAEDENKAIEASDPDAFSKAKPGDVIRFDAPPMEELVSVTFRVECTREQLTALGKYMVENGIKYRRA